jgi:hypothetical protein
MWIYMILINKPYNKKKLVNDVLNEILIDVFMFYIYYFS